MKKMRYKILMVMVAFCLMISMNAWADTYYGTFTNNQNVVVNPYANDMTITGNPGTAIYLGKGAYPNQGLATITAGLNSALNYWNNHNSTPEFATPVSNGYTIPNTPNADTYTFSVTPDSGNYLYAVIHFGGAANKTDYFFALTAGTYTITAPEGAGGLSGITLFNGHVTVPVPAAGWLLGSGLVGLFGIRRKMKKNS